MDLVYKDVGLINELLKKNNIPSDLSKLLFNIFKNGKRQLGERSHSTSITKILENYCQEVLRAPNFPSQLIDKNPRKKGFEIKF